MFLKSRTGINSLKLKSTIFYKNNYISSLNNLKRPGRILEIRRDIHQTSNFHDLNKNKGSPLEPITDDQSTSHLPKTPIEPIKHYKRRSKFYRVVRVIRILTGGVVTVFLICTGLVVGSEYLEDKSFRAGVRENLDNPFGSSRFTLDSSKKGPPTALWPRATNSSGLEKNKVKPKLVVLGTGWGSIGVLKNIEKDLYDIVVVSPNNYFLFTPLLPSVTVGTLEPRSLLEPIRRILKRFGPNEAHYFQAKAIDVDVEGRRVLLEGHNGSTFYLSYDHLIMGVGSQSMDFGVKGLERANFLHSIQDARSIRSKIFDLIETAVLPSTSREERKKLLSFVVCGGGPTGVEFAAELEDFLITDLASYFPEFCKDISISIIQSREHILNTYDEKISLYAENLFRNREMNLITNARVKEIKEDAIAYSVKVGEKVEEREIPYGLVLWSTGIAMGPLVKKLTQKIPEQTRHRAMTVDQLLRVYGVPNGSIFALGDCASVEIPKLIPRLMDIFSQADINGDGSLDFDEFSEMVRGITHNNPGLAIHMSKLVKMFNKYDVDNSGTLELDELEALLKGVDSVTTSLPATAQVANQQGKFLAKELNRIAKEFYHNNPNIDPKKAHLPDDVIAAAARYADDNIEKFIYKHLGSLAYIGNSAVAELVAPTPTSSFSPKVVLSGFSAMYLWRSIYWSEQVSLRSRLLISTDWTKRVLFGRDLSKF